MVSEHALNGAKGFVILNYILSGFAILVALISFIDSPAFDFSDAHMTALGGYLGIAFLISIPLTGIAVLGTILNLFRVFKDKKAFRSLLVSFLVLVLCVGIYLLSSFLATSGLR